jgi:hypothetical protein
MILITPCWVTAMDDKKSRRFADFFDSQSYLLTAGEPVVNQENKNRATY